MITLLYYNYGAAKVMGYIAHYFTFITDLPAPSPLHPPVAPFVLNMWGKKRKRGIKP